jgi:hypothetical protein
MRKLTENAPDIHNSMRLFINLSEMVIRRTFPHKPFASVRNDDIIQAYIEVDDLRDVMEGHWEQMDHGEDANGEPLYPDLPRRFDDLSDDQVTLIIAWFGGLISQARAALAPVAALDRIPISRRLTTLVDLTRPLGVHWSYGAEANPHTKHRGAHVLFAEVANADVDWTTTLARALFWWEEEREITPVADALVQATRVEFASGTTLRA